MREVQKFEIELCKSNDPKMVGIIFERLHPSLISLCYRYLGNIDDSEDVVMISWMKVIQKFQTFTFEHPLSFYAYMKRICIHECLNLLRSKNNFHLISIHEVNELDEPFSEDVHLIDTAILLEKIAALPIGYRTVFNLFAIEGYSHAQIASMLQINESTSKSQFRKARLSLAKTIENPNKTKKSHDR